MKRMTIAILALAALVLAGTVAFAWDETYTGTVDIPEYWNFISGSSFNFGGTGAQAPTAHSWFSSSKVLLEIETNRGFTISFTSTQFHNASADTYLPTERWGRSKFLGGSWGGSWGPWTKIAAFPATPGGDYTDAHTHSYTGPATHDLHQGYAAGNYFFKAYRSGLADHYGTYTASLTVTVTAL